MHDQDRFYITLTLATGLFLAFVALCTSSAQAQHPTAVTSIINAAEDTTLEVNYSGGLLMRAKLGDVYNYSAPNDSIPAEGAGTRMMWYPEKAAFRAGRVGDLKDGTQWDASNVGNYSVALGVDTEASGLGAVAMGRLTTASGSGATAIGRTTTASGPFATAMGQSTTASGSEAVAMGSNTTASGFEATAMGAETTASGNRATAVGRGTIAATNQSASIGECNSANRSDDGTLFVAGKGVYSSGACGTFSDALVLKYNGDFGVEGAFRADLAGGTYAGHFQGNKSGSAGEPSNHVALVENRGGTNSDGLAIEAGPDSEPGSAVNYLTFFDGDGDPIGAIQGNGSGGIERVSGSGDFAEELPVANKAEAPEPAQLVGVRGGKASLDTEDADRVMIASRAPILKGNATPATNADNERRVAVAFVGQVPAKVRGEVAVGDLIVASGQKDGIGRAVAPSEYRHAEHGPIAGQAWSGKSSSEVGEVTVAVGLGRSGAVAEQLEKQRKANREQRSQIQNLKKRLAALEAERSPSAVAGWTGSAAGLFCAFLLGGLFGAGFLWRRRR